MLPLIFQITSLITKITIKSHYHSCNVLTSTLPKQSSFRDYKSLRRGGTRAQIARVRKSEVKLKQSSKFRVNCTQVSQSSEDTKWLFQISMVVFLLQKLLGCSHTEQIQK
jgi:hypothetical protein